MDKNAFLTKLHTQLQAVHDPMQYTVFWAVCKRLQEYWRGESKTRYVTKGELLQLLVDKQIMQFRKDKRTGIRNKLPDDRPVRNAARKLLKRGYPIIASSKSTGYFIAITRDEIAAPMLENHKKALDMLATEKGYEQAISFINGQQTMNI